MFSNDPRVALESLSNTTGTIGPVELRAVNTTTPVRQWLGKFVKITPHHFGGEEYGVVFAVGSLEGRGHDDSLWAIWAYRAQRARHYFMEAGGNQLHPRGEDIFAGRLEERRASEYTVEIVPMPEPERVPTIEPRPTVVPVTFYNTYPALQRRDPEPEPSNPRAGTIRTCANGTYEYADGYGNWRNFPPVDQPAPEAPKKPKKVKKKAVKEPEPEKLPLRKILIKGDRHDQG